MRKLGFCIGCRWHRPVDMFKNITIIIRFGLECGRHSWTTLGISEIWKTSASATTSCTMASDISVPSLSLHLTYDFELGFHYFHKVLVKITSALNADCLITYMCLDYLTALNFLLQIKTNKHLLWYLSEALWRDRFL